MISTKTLPKAAAALCVLALAGLTAPRAQAEPRTFALDPAHLHVGFLVEHIGFAKTLGVFTEIEGTVVFDEEARSLDSIDVTIQADSVHTGHERRDDHLRGGDFLDVAAHPEIAFTLTDANPTGPRTGTITGDLTMRGETHPVTLDVTWNKSGRYPFGDEQYVVGISARGALQRSLWGMTYAVENGLVGDRVEIIIEAELVRREE